MHTDRRAMERQNKQGGGVGPPGSIYLHSPQSAQQDHDSILRQRQLNSADVTGDQQQRGGTSQRNRCKTSTYNKLDSDSTLIACLDLDTSPYAKRINLPRLNVILDLTIGLIHTEAKLSFASLAN